MDEAGEVEGRAEAFLAGGGEMGALMRACDWSGSPLGRPATWPQSLRTIVRLMLNSAHPMYVWWGTSLACLYNDAYRRTIGPERHPSSLGRPAREVWAEIWDVVAPQIAQVLEGRAATWHESRLVPIMRNGRREDVFWTHSYSPIDEEGAPFRVGGVVVVCAETTERKLAERALEEMNAELVRRVDEANRKLIANEAMIQIFFKHSSECYAILTEAVDGHFRYDEINPATERLYGKSRAEVVGRLTVEVVGAEMGARLDHHMSACLRSGLPYRYERVQGAGAVEAVATPVPTEPDAPRRVVVSARDVTEQRRLEEQLRQAQKMEAIGQLTGGLAHDFNNLLAGISGSLELAQRRRREGRVDDCDRYINVAQDAANRAATLTQRLLAFSRRQTLDAKATNVNRVVAGLEDLIRRTVGPSIEVEVIGASGLWPALVDSSQLDSALLNLCINARDAMPAGGRLTVETANKWLDDRAAAAHNLVPGQYVSLCVTDTGVGMPPEIVARIFDPFFTTKPLGEGTGLGLSMVYGFTRQSGGQVRVYSEVGKGTTMCLYLPRHDEEAAGDGGPEVYASSSAAPKNQTVLVVDDEPAVRMFVVDVLAEAGYNIIEAWDGPGALMVLQSPEVLSLVITDIGLPGGMNGRQVAEAARSLRPGLKMLFITGYAENSVLNSKHIEPGTRVLTKPFAVADLVRVAGELIAGG